MEYIEIESEHVKLENKLAWHYFNFKCAIKLKLFEYVIKLLLSE